MNSKNLNSNTQLPSRFMQLAVLLMFLMFSASAYCLQLQITEPHSLGPYAEGQDVWVIPDARGGFGTQTWTATGLPSGVVLDPPHFRIHGSPDPGTAGTGPIQPEGAYDVELTVTDDTGSDSRQYQLIILPEDQLVVVSPRRLLSVVEGSRLKNDRGDRIKLRAHVINPKCLVDLYFWFI